MGTFRALGHVAGALALAVALAGCGGDDADSAVTDDTGSVASGTDDVNEDADGAQDSDDPAGDETSDDSADEQDDAAAAGVYRDYSDEAVADTSYDTTVLFFHAPWCPECRAFEQAIQSEVVPDGVQILKTDYDTELDLREQYGITIQSSFVKVDADGDELSKWFGYGEEKSVDRILDELG